MKLILGTAEFGEAYGREVTTPPTLEELMGWEVSEYKPPKIGAEVARVHGAAIL